MYPDFNKTNIYYITIAIKFCDLFKKDFQIIILNCFKNVDFMITLINIYGNCIKHCFYHFNLFLWIIMIKDLRNQKYNIK
jgi:hypothetical protein